MGTARVLSECIITCSISMRSRSKHHFRKGLRFTVYSLQSESESHFAFWNRCHLPLQNSPHNLLSCADPEMSAQACSSPKTAVRFFLTSHSDDFFLRPGDLQQVYDCAQVLPGRRLWASIAKKAERTWWWGRHQDCLKWNQCSEYAKAGSMHDTHRGRGNSHVTNL